jgi:hypothetical protein
MKFFVIIFGLLTMYGGFLFILYGLSYEIRYSDLFFLKEFLGLLFLIFGTYLIYQAIQDIKSKRKKTS